MEKIFFKLTLLMLYFILFPFCVNAVDWSSYITDKTLIEAYQYCNSLKESGYSWRLPKLNELRLTTGLRGKFWVSDAVEDVNNGMYYDFDKRKSVEYYNNNKYNVICIRQKTSQELELEEKLKKVERAKKEAEYEARNAQYEADIARYEAGRAKTNEQKANARADDAYNRAYQAMEEREEMEKYVKKHDLEHPYKIPGISLMVVGAVVAAGGVTGFHFAAENKYDKYQRMKRLDTAQDAVDNGTSKEDYLKKAKNLRNDANMFRALEITSGAVGGAMIITGVILVAITKKKPNSRALTNISVEPSKNGFYASAGFNF